MPNILFSENKKAKTTYPVSFVVISKIQKARGSRKSKSESENRYASMTGSTAKTRNQLAV
jgi:hypothetical protein